MTTRNFDEEYPQETATHTFVFGGQEFHVNDTLHPSVFLHQEDGVAGLVAFVAACVRSEERQVFKDIVTDSETRVTSEQLGNLVSWIIEVVSDRPTNAPDSSGATVAGVS